MEAVRKKVKSMGSWDLVINFIWGMKNATHIFLVCSCKKKKKKKLIQGPVKGNPGGRAASWRLEDEKEYFTHVEFEVPPRKPNKNVKTDG